MDSQTIGSPFPKTCDDASQIETLVCIRNSKVDSIPICRYCKAFHMSSEECGDIPIRMNEDISDCSVPLVVPLPSLGRLSPISIHLDGLPDDYANGLTTATQSMGLDGSDGTAGEEGRKPALSRLTTSGNKPALGTPLCKTTSCFCVFTFE